MPSHTIFDERPESQDRAIRVIEKLGYTFVPRAESDIKRGARSRILFEDELQKFLSTRAYPFGKESRFFSGGSINKAIRALDAPINTGLSMCNKEIYDLLCGGKSLEECLPDGSMQSFDIDYIDFDHPENNIFQVTDEFEVERLDGKYSRPDIVLLVNGIPLVVIECKKSSVDVMEGVRQNIRNWGNDYIPQLYKFSQIVIAANPNKVLYGTCGTPFKYFVAWREDEKEWLLDWCRKYSPDGSITEQDRSLVSLLEPSRLLEIIKNFILFDNNTKIIARYKQYFAIKKSIRRIKLQDGAGIRSGVIWHTQGSGKTLTMIMLTKMIMRDKDIKDARFIMVTDRVNLDKQIRDNFIDTRMNPHRAKTGRGLIELLKEKENSVITTLVNKFEAAIKQSFCDESDNIFLFIDEGHRTQYGMLNRYMERVLPNSIKIAFTGTPLIKQKKGLESSKNTYLKFGGLIDKYTLEDAIEDKVTVPIIYEGRVINQNVSSEKIDEHLKFLTVGLSKRAIEDLKHKWSRFLTLSQTKQRIDMVAFDVYEHFISYVKPKGFKAILTCSSRAFAVDVFYKLKRMVGINPAVVISPNAQNEDDTETNTPEGLKRISEFFKKEVDPLYRNNYEAYEEYVTNSFIDSDGEIDLLIVKDKLLTGFDAPVAAVLYVDKFMQDHTLLQAIARVNRVYENKDFGLIVDYIGIFKKLNSALDMYSDEKSGMNLFDKEDIRGTISGIAEEKAKLAKAYELIWQIFDGIDKDEASSNIWQERLREYEVRREFYERLAAFAKLVDFLFTSYNLFEEVGQTTANEYRKDYLFFKKLKDSVSLRFNDSIDFSAYEDGIRQLLDTYVNARDARMVIEPLDILNKAKMQEQLSRLGTREARAEAIQTRQVEVLETKKHDDPIMYMTFMQKINETLDEYIVERNNEAYLSSMEQIAEDFREGRSAASYPSSIDNDSDSKAFYGSVLSGIKKAVGSDGGINPDEVAELSMAIKEAIVNYAKRDWRDNIISHRNIRSRLDDLLFDFMEDNNLNWPPDTIDIIIDEVMLTAKKRY